MSGLRTSAVVSGKVGRTFWRCCLVAVFAAVLNEDARGYLEVQGRALQHWEKLTFTDAVLAPDTSAWQVYLSGLGIVSAKAVRVRTVAALLGGVIAQGVGQSLRILSDGAGQFNVLLHGLCWVHAERALRRLQGNTKQQRQNITEMQDLQWLYYRQLQQYPQQPTAEGFITPGTAIRPGVWTLLPPPS